MIEVNTGPIIEVDEDVDGATIIQQRLKMVEESREQTIRVMDRLQEDCIYCGLRVPRPSPPPRKGHPDDGYEPHTYRSCKKAEAAQCEVERYEIWRERID